MNLKNCRKALCRITENRGIYKTWEKRPRKPENQRIREKSIKLEKVIENQKIREKERNL